MTVELWTDGSGLAQGGPGGWAYILVAIEDREVVMAREDSGTLTWATNQRAEMTAVLRGLLALTRPTAVTVVTDSEYVMHGFTQGWVARWKVNGWTNREGDDVANRDLWEALAAAAAEHDVAWRHVKGHAIRRRCSCGWDGPAKFRRCQDCREPAERYEVHPLNARCDVLAGAARRSMLGAVAA